MAVAAIDMMLGGPIHLCLSVLLLSIPAQRAARRLVDAVLAGRSPIELTPLSWVGRRAHGLAPRAGSTRSIRAKGPQRGSASGQ